MTQQLLHSTNKPDLRSNKLSICSGGKLESPFEGCVHSTGASSINLATF